jgi:hypothetical protein
LLCRGCVLRLGVLEVSLVCLGVLEVSLECLGDAFAVAGGQEVEQQTAGYGHGEPGVCAGGGLVGPGLGQAGRDVGDPRLDGCLEEPFGAGAPEQGVGVQLEEQPFLRPQLRVAEVLPAAPGVSRSRSRRSWKPRKGGGWPTP